MITLCIAFSSLSLSLRAFLKLNVGKVSKACSKVTFDISETKLICSTRRGLEKKKCKTFFASDQGTAK